MKPLNIFSIAICLLFASCTSNQPISTLEGDDALPPQVRLKKDHPDCPTEASVYGYVNLMPGPGFDREKVAASVTADIVATGNWAAAYKKTDDPETIVLSLFRSASQIVKPPAKRFHARNTPRPPNPDPSPKDQAHRYSVRFSILKPSARRIVLRCGGEEIAEGYVRSAR